MNSNITFIVRSCGERTTAACLSLLQQEFGEAAVHVVEGIPFEDTLRKGYQIACEAGRRWTITVDADVLIHQGTLEHLAAEMENHEPNVIGTSARTLDRFFGGPRYVGVRIFRTALLEKLIPRIPPPGTQIRPETYTHRLLEKEGYQFLKSDTLTGVHGYEQSLADVFRTISVVARKFPQAHPALLSFWSRNATTAVDYAVALLSLSASIHSNTVSRIDKSQFNADSLLAGLGIEELPSLNNPVTSQTVAHWMTSHRSNPEYLELEKILFYQADKPTFARRAKSRVRDCLHHLFRAPFSEQPQ